MDNNSPPPDPNLNGMSQQPPAPQYQQFVPPPQTASTDMGLQPPMQPEGKNDKASYVIAIVAVCFAAIAAAWSFIGGACCGWAGWGFAFIGLVLGIVSLVMKRSTLGFWAIGLSIFSVVWVFISAAFFLPHNAARTTSMTTTPAGAASTTPGAATSNSGTQGQ